ncbi:MAG: hypothetical protein EZS28_009419 [Streblomastix strix]|uniref:Uncharacterized protein n=1 Tax=Streblomastix strix TaxID=222440 RepID=A0A5J4WJH4_9EUKA|nr:MAG: hypothetical protein EZS28_009419 [Streblomastix strix]
MKSPTSFLKQAKFTILSQALFAYITFEPLDAAYKPLFIIGGARASIYTGQIKQLPLKQYKSKGQHPNPQFSKTSGNLFPLIYIIPEKEVKEATGMGGAIGS